MDLTKKITISQQGMVEKDLFLSLISPYEGIAVSLDNEERLELVDQVGLEWNLPRAGKIPKRLSKYVKRKYNIDLAQEYLEKVGNKLSASLMKWDLEVRFEFLDWKHPLWRPGAYGDDGSCYFGGRKGAVSMMRNEGNFFVMFITKDGDKFARAWVQEVDNENIVFFNLYSVGNKLVGLALAQQLAKHFNLPYRKINLVNDGSGDGELWINQEAGYWIGCKELKLDSNDTPYYDFRMEEIREDEEDNDEETEYVSCRNCDYEGETDEFYFDYAGRRICESCRNNYYICCHMEDKYYPFENVTWIEADMFFYNDRLYYNFEGYVNNFANSGIVKRIEGTITSYHNNEKELYTLLKCYDEDDCCIGYTKSYVVERDGEYYLCETIGLSTEIVVEITNKKDLCVVTKVYSKDKEIWLDMEFPYAPEKNCSESEQYTEGIIINRKSYALMKENMLIRNCEYVLLSYPFSSVYKAYNTTVRDGLLNLVKVGNKYVTSSGEPVKVDDTFAMSLCLWDGNYSNVVSVDGVAYKAKYVYRRDIYFTKSKLLRPIKVDVDKDGLPFVLRGYEILNRKLYNELIERSKLEHFTELEQIERHLQEEEGELVSGWSV